MIQLRYLLVGITLCTSFLVRAMGVETAAACPTIAVTGSNVNCYGGSNGSAQVAISNGSGNYTISWSNGVNNAFNPGLSAGTYTVNVKDNVSGCTVLGAYVVTAPDPMTVTQLITNVKCRTQSTGVIDISVVGGTPPYTYVWSNGMSTQDITGVPAGNYSVTITDSKLCSTVRNYTITQPASVVNGTSTVTNPACFATTTGSINFEPFGGTPPYTYVWSTGASTQDISNLGDGPYNVILRDANLCQQQFFYTLTQPPMLTGTLNKTDVLCFGDETGSVTVNPIGGTPPYMCEWENEDHLFSENGTFLGSVPAGTYEVILTDSKGCTFANSIPVNEPPLLTISSTHVNVSCFAGNDGSINATVSGGTLPYTFAWTNAVGTFNSSSEDINTLIEGSYTLLVTDANGCQESINVVITQPNAPIQVGETHVNVLCFGNNTGIIDLTVTGGTPTYSHSWSSGQTSQDLTNLLAGNYNYVVTDSKGCTESGSITITQPLAPLNVTNTITHVNCFGESNGDILLTTTGGTSPYSYSWANSTFLLSYTAEDLLDFPADAYIFVTTDANGCTFSDTLTITEPPLLENSLVGVNILCHGGSNGSIEQTVTGGVLPYSYLWNTGAVVEDLSSLIAGTYSVTVTDAHNCTVQDQITLTEPLDSLTFEYIVKDVLCNDGTDGSIFLTVAGGTSPYNYTWSNGDNQALNDTLTAGYYEFLVTDFNGCTITDSIFVDQPDPLVLNEVITPVTCFGLSDGIIDISPAGGTGPYDFTWFNSTFALAAQTEDLVDFPADIYQVEIMDSNNCFYEHFFEIEQPNPLTITYSFDIVSCAGGSDGNIFVDISGGNPTYITNWSNGSTTEDLLNIPYGIYELIVTDQKNCMDSIEVEISQPDSIYVTFETVEVSCVDQADGQAFAFPAGGNGGYSYAWTHGGTDYSTANLSNQYYSIVVTDILGCYVEDSVFISKNNQDCVDPVNAFSPNDDFYNDSWVIDNMYLYPDAEVQIFNRWGNLIHQQNGIYEPWDGSVKGSAAPSDTYYYIINLNKEERKPLTGNITIVR